jgi:hypothetical protein
VKFKPLLTDQIAYETADDTDVVWGRKTSRALGVVPLRDGWASMMLLAGRMLVDEFATFGEACAFNEALQKELGAACGACDVEEFFSLSGGEDAARAAVEKCRRKASGK